MEIKDRLKEVLDIQSYSHDETRMKAFLMKKLKEIKDTVDEEDSFLVTKDSFGNIFVERKTLPSAVSSYPCIAAHMDTVHNITANYHVIEKNDPKNEDIVFTTNTGIGGDDKVGIFIALEALSNYENIKVVFFTQEEIGCVGSKGCDLEWFNDCGFILQCDRKGNDEVIRNSGYSSSGGMLYSNDFLSEMEGVFEKYGYKESHEGIYTDVVTLKGRGLEASVANIGCGYYNAHSPSEWISWNDVLNCKRFVFALIDEGYGISYPTSDSDCTELASDSGWYTGDEYPAYTEESDKEIFEYNKSISPRYKEPLEVGDKKYHMPETIDCPCGLSEAVNDNFNSYYCKKCEEYIATDHDLKKELSND
jgi:tripeptide aminopeptidase